MTNFAFNSRKLTTKTDEDNEIWRNISRFRGKYTES